MSFVGLQWMLKAQLSFWVGLAGLWVVKLKFNFRNKMRAMFIYIIAYRRVSWFCLEYVAIKRRTGSVEVYLAVHVCMFHIRDIYLLEKFTRASKILYVHSNEWTIINI